MFAALVAAAPAQARPEDRAQAAAPTAADSVYAEASRRAAELASRAYAPPAEDLPAPFRNLDYDGYRKLRPQPDHAFWGELGQPFAVLPLPTGGLFAQGVNVFLVEGGETRPASDLSAIIDFVDYPQATAEERAALRPSGFQVISRPGVAGAGYEAAVFQGASYFRAVGEGMVYGASARALAIGAGSSTEEFPRFTDFWVVRPETADGAITVVALMDSPSVAGAYRFSIQPGAETVMGVEAELHPRVDLADVGVAPLSSMFLRGPVDAAAADPRAEVHDSDGLAIETASGERIWRAVANPRGTEISAFAGPAPRAFALEQRSRAATAYADPEALYERRPSVVIEPGQGWGAGEVRLVEIPTPTEYNDNIVALWRPAVAWKAGETVRLSYRIRWSADVPAASGRIVAARVQPAAAGRQHVEIDFAGAPEAAMRPDVWAGAGAISGVDVHDEIGVRRLSFDFDPGRARTIELRAALNDSSSQQTETWLFRWTPE
jgi:glucans biosynthesis protein